LKKVGYSKFVLVNSPIVFVIYNTKRIQETFDIQNSLSESMPPSPALPLAQGTAQYGHHLIHSFAAEAAQLAPLL